MPGQVVQIQTDIRTCRMTFDTHITAYAMVGGREYRCNRVVTELMMLNDNYGQIVQTELERAVLEVREAINKENT